MLPNKRSAALRSLQNTLTLLKAAAKAEKEAEKVAAEEHRKNFYAQIHKKPEK
jgi:hypothetical protein